MDNARDLPEKILIAYVSTFHVKSFQIDGLDI